MAENYPALTLSQADRRLEELRTDPAYPHHGREDANAVENQFARQLALACDSLRGSLEYLSRDQHFDREAARITHESALQIPTTMQGDPGFWRWLAIEHGPDLVEFRHGKKGKSAVDNFGLGGRWENLFMRSWFRAELSFDEDSSDPYWLTVRGGSDFWRSGILRHRYSSSRNLNKAFVKFAYPDPSEPSRGIWRMRSKSNPEGSGFQQLWRRLARLHATVAYETLSIEQCTEILEHLSEDLPRDFH